MLVMCHCDNKDLYIVNYTSLYNTLKIKVQFNNSLKHRVYTRQILNYVLTICKLLCIPVVTFYLTF